jgi:hypothetical protein
LSDAPFNDIEVLPLMSFMKWIAASMLTLLPANALAAGALPSVEIDA